MKMIRHDYELIKLSLWPDDRSVQPFILHDFAERAQVHFIRDDFSEDPPPCMSGQRQKVHPCLSIVIPPQPYRPSMMNQRIIPHALFL
jgi:hypothetical protein